MSRWSRIIPRSIAGRMAVILIAGILLSYLINLGSYDLDRIGVINDEAQDRITERVASAVRLSERGPVADRADITESLSDKTIKIEWSRSPALSVADTADSELTEDLIDWLDIDRSRIRSGGQPNGGIIICVALTDGSWVNASAPSLPASEYDLSSLIISTSITVIGIIFLSLFLVRWVTRPLRQLTDAADRLGTDFHVEPLPETGPLEVRHAAVAFNTMQQRIQRLINDRTQMFAAISHDLKTPVTRLKLRAEFIADEAERVRILRDLDDMEQMIGSFLAFLREETNHEDSRLTDLSAILQTICDDYSDAGHPVKLTAPASCPYSCRALAIKRALSNVIDNAIKYGDQAEVSLSETGDAIQIEITDQGPGLAAEEQEKVFLPFYRIEASRNRDTGGTGLGLTVARSIVRAHGGDIALGNRAEKGLMVIIKLPITGKKNKHFAR